MDDKPDEKVYATNVKGWTSGREREATLCNPTFDLRVSSLRYSTDYSIEPLTLGGTILTVYEPLKSPNCSDVYVPYPLGAHPM